MSASLLILAAAFGADDPVVIEASLADAPVEASLTVAALRQLDTGEKGRVAYALYQLEGLLALPGFRRKAVTDALETAGALGILQRAEATVKGKALKELRERLEKEVRERVGADGSDGATKLPVVPATLVEQPDLQWTAAESKGWWTVDVAPDRELEVYVQGCDYAWVSLFDEQGRRLGSERAVDASTAARVWAPAEVRTGKLRVREGGHCASSWSVAAIGREAPPVLRADQPSSVQSLKVGQTYRVRPRTPEDLHFAFQAEPGGVYVVRTEDLAGRTDTALRIETAGSVFEDDDGGMGLGSAIRFDALGAASVNGVVSLMQSDPDTAYRLVVEEVRRFEVAATQKVISSPTALPGAAWNGFVLPLVFEGDELELTFEGSTGAVYSFHTGLDVELDGPGEIASLRLVGDEVRPVGSVRPVQSFLALDDGPYRARVSRGPNTEAEGPVFFQFLASSEVHITPHVQAFGKGRRDALFIEPGRDLREFEGGVLDVLEADGDGWVKFPVQPGTLYRMQVDGTQVDGRVSATVHEFGSGDVLVPEVDPEPRVRVAGMASRSGTWALQVRNRGDHENRVRVAVVAEKAYSGLRPGDRVRVGSHTVVNGDANWVEPMARYVGRQATIMELAGSDGAGQWVVRVDVDDGEFAWRTRDLELVQRASIQ